MPGARKHGAAEGNRQADGGAEEPERGTEGAREGVPTAAVPPELCALAAARPRGRLPAPVKPRDGPPWPSEEPDELVSFTPPRRRLLSTSGCLGHLFGAPGWVLGGPGSA